MNTIPSLNTRLAALTLALAAAALSACDRRASDVPVTPSTPAPDTTPVPTTPPVASPTPMPPASAASQ